jgi:hydrogenase maturation protease
MTRVLVLGWGNPGRGDDAIGPRLLERLEAEAARRPDWAEHAFITDFQLQPEHALDLEGAGQVLFVDASATAHVPYGFSRIAPARDRSFSTHALSPQAVLAVLEGIEGAAPPAWLLAVRGEQFELGAPMSAAAEARLAAAEHLAVDLLSHPEPRFWDQALVGGVECTS